MMFLRYFTSPPHLRRALALWVVLAAAVSIKIACVGGDGSVYPALAGGSQRWWNEWPLYFVPGQLPESDFRYSPTFAVAFTPFARLPDTAGAILWCVTSIVVLVWSLFVLMRDVLPPPSGEGWSPWDKRLFLTLTLLGSAVGIWSGQSNAIIIALIGFALAAIARRRWWLASFLLAATAFIKLWPLAIVLLLAVYWPRQLLGRFCVACLVLAAIPFLTKPPEIVLSRYHGWHLRMTGPFQARHLGYRDAWTFWEQLCAMFGREPHWDAAGRVVHKAIGLIASLGALGWCLWRFPRNVVLGRTPVFCQSCLGRWHSRPRLCELPGTAEGGCATRTCRFIHQTTTDRVLEESHGREKCLLAAILSIWAAWQLLFGPATEQLTYGILAPSAAWAVLVSFAERRDRWLAAAAWALLTFMASGDIEKAVLYVIPLGKTLLPLGVVLFVVWLVRCRRLACGAATGDNQEKSLCGT